MAEPFRIGIIGAGTVSDGYHAPVLARFPGVRLLWVCDKDVEKARRFASRHRIPASGGDLEALSDVDAVLVAIPVGLRSRPLETVFRRRWHAFVEKPFAANLPDHDAILAAARAAGVQVGVGLMRRFYRPTRIARELVERRVFGGLREVWAAEGAPMRGSGRGGDWYQADPAAAGGGVLIETGSHVVDQAFFISGAERFSGLRAELVADGGLDLEARVAVRAAGPFQEDGFDLRVSVSRLRDLCNGLVLRFERGIVKVPLSPDGRVELLDDSFRRLSWLDGDARAAVGVYQAFYLEWEAFLAQCRGGGTSEVDAASARVSTELISGAYASTAAGASR